MPLKRHPVAVAQNSDLFAGIPLDAALIGRLRRTFESIQSQELRLAEVFYAKLFTAAPHLRPMFRADLTSQAQKLTAALDAVVRNFENPAANTGTLSDLGRRHAGYGVQPAHYTLAVDLLVDAMRDVGGEGLDETALREWKRALELISAQMIAASTPH